MERIPVHSRNPKAGLAMPRRQLSPQDLQEIRELAARWGKIVARHAFGTEGPGTEVDLSAMEQVARAAAAGLTEGTLTTLLEQQAGALGAEQSCPDCGRPCPTRRAERTLACRDGPLTQGEPVCYCPACRRDFFPPAAPAARRRPRLQPRRAADGR
jgi:hypothetical protein